MKKLNYKKRIRLLNPKYFRKEKLNNKTINLIDIEYGPKKAFEKISTKSNLFIENSFKLAFKIMERK